MFQTITFKGFTALVTAHIKSSDYGHAVYLEIAGAEAEVKAIWSKLVSAKTKKSGSAEGVAIGDLTVHMEKNTKHLTLRSSLPNGQHVVGLLHPRATVMKSDSTLFYLMFPADHEGPPPEFFPRLARSLAVPIKAEWAPWLWEEGLAIGKQSWQTLISKLPGEGYLAGYVVKTHNAAKWLELIQKGLGFEICEQCSKPAKGLVERKTIIGRGTSYQREKVEMICEECNNGQESQT